VTGTGTVRFVDLETARASRGLRMAVITSVPSPWSDSARGCFGQRLTALDFYWAAALGFILPLPDSVRPIAPAMRPVFGRIDEQLAAAITPALRAHRDRIAPRCFALPGPTA
jgi:hypothetical protein